MNLITENNPTVQETLEKINTLDELIQKLKNAREIDRNSNNTKILLELLSRLSKVFHSSFSLEKNPYNKQLTYMEIYSFINCIYKPIEGYISILSSYQLWSPEQNIEKLRKSKLLHKMTKELCDGIRILEDILYNFRLDKLLYGVSISQISELATVANSIVDKFNDNTEKTRGQFFYYLILPDFFCDVHTVDISCLKKDESKLSIMYIPLNLLKKDLFPAKAIMCHEIAHQVGSYYRNREIRLKCLIKSFITYIFCSSHSIKMENIDFDEDFDCIIDMFAEIFSKSIVQELLSFEDEENNKNDIYYLGGLRDILESTDYLLSLFDFKNYKEAYLIRDDICHQLKAEFKKLSTPQKDKICSWLDHWYNSSLFGNHDVNSDFIVAALYNRLKNHCEVLLEKGSIYQEYVDYCSAVMQAFSESYADLRMIEHYNIENFDDYVMICDRCKLNFKPNDSLEFGFRKNVVECYFNAETYSNDASPKSFSSYVMINTQNILNGYIMACRLDNHV